MRVSGGRRAAGWGRMILNQTAEYALRAVLAIARAPDGQPVGAARVAAELGIPANYLSKTLHQLARAGILESIRGKLGGFRLARPGNRISLLDIVSEFDDIRGKRACLLGRTTCSDVQPCIAHHRWKAVADRQAAFFRETTVADLLRQPEGEA
jgi:Rrf2 family protein